MAVLEEVQQAVEGVAGASGDSVVAIGERPRGSGVVIGKGRVLTNAHNLRGEEVHVGFHDGRTETGQVVGADPDGDLAVISVETGDAPAAEYAESKPELGSPVFGVARGRDLRVTLGFVSALGRSFRGPRGRRIQGSVEHTAPLARGSSGGPLVDSAGRLVGINTNRLGEGFYLAIAADDSLRERVDALGRGEGPSRTYLGVGIAPSHVARRLRRSVGLPERDGLLVRAVEEGSPADRAGIQKGDLIVSASGKAVSTVDDLYEALDAIPKGGSFELGIVRGAEERTVGVSAGEAKSEV